MKKALLLTAALALAPGLACADDDYYGRIEDPVVLKECGACHMAFQPRFLPASSWSKIMDGLADHFGEDASLDEDTTRHIADYLVKNAGRSRSADAPIRITELRWFQHEHSEEVSRRAMEKAKTMANCQACHRDAARGYFDDD